MKTLLNIITFSLLFYSTPLPQFYADSVTPNYVIEFMKIADDFAKQNDPDKGKRKFFTDAEIEHIAELYYKCYNDDPVGFQKYFHEKHQEWEKAPLDVVTGEMKIRPWMKIYKLRDKIANRYGIVFTEVIGTPAFLRCKYITWKFSDYYSKSLNTHFKSHNFIFLIEDILKGNKFFSIGDTISILMLSNIESPSPDFIEDHAYLIPVKTNLGFHEGSFNLTFSFLRTAYDVWIMGKPPKTFPIENEVIKNCEYFGIKDTSWIDFKRYFKETYLIFQ